MNNSVLISGAGIAGPTLAFWLKVAGFQPTLIERAPALRTGGYVIDFWGLGYDIAERMELASVINRNGYHVREMQVVDDLGRRVSGFGTNVFDELMKGRYVTVRRSDLSRLLFEKLKGTTEVIFESEVLDLQERDDCVQVQLKNAGARRFGLVIGAEAYIRPFAGSRLGRRSSLKGRSATRSPRLRSPVTVRATMTFI